MKKQMKVKAEFRSASLAVIDQETRTIEFSGSSECPVERYDYDEGKTYMEVLSHDPADVDLSRMNGGPLLDSHWGDQVGVIESVEVKDGRTMVRARFSKASARANELWQDIQDGIRRGISTGYTKTKILSSEMIDGVKHVRFAWQPFEFSLVTIPADPTVGIGRDLNTTERALEFDEKPVSETKIFII